MNRTLTSSRIGILALLSSIIAPLAAQPPEIRASNDNFGNRISLQGEFQTVGPISTRNASLEPGEPSNHFGKSIWFSWKAPANLRVTLSTTGSSTGQSPVITVFVGDDLANLCPVARGQGGEAFFVAVAEKTYQIALSSPFQGESGGDAMLTLASAPFGSITPVVGQDNPRSRAPANDNFANRQILKHLPLVVVGYSGAASTEVDERLAGPSVPTLRGTIWYTYTAERDEWFHVRFEGFGMPSSAAALYRGDNFGSMQLFDSGYDGSMLKALLKKGDSCHLVVGCTNTDRSALHTFIISANSTEPLTSGILVGPERSLQHAPANDLFRNAQPLNGDKLSVYGYDYEATREAFEPEGSGTGTLWYRWSASQGGKTRLTSPNRVTVYKGNDIARLQSVPLESKSFVAEAGATYHIALGGKPNEPNPGYVSFDLVGPAQPDGR